MNKNNYWQLLEQIVSNLNKEGCVPSLLLHSCCAPCSSYCIEYLSQFFNITVFYYNPNIYPDDEYFMRVEEQKRFIKNFPTINPVSFIEGDFDKEEFFRRVKGFEQEPERGKRCQICFDMRLSKTAEIAKTNGFDYFTTTLTISPMKNAALLNEIGFSLANDYGVSWLPSDFKKNNGFLRSTQISNEYNMYRQDYCGCVFSYLERQKQKKIMEV